MTEDTLKRRLEGEELQYKIKRTDEELRTMLYKIHDVVIRQTNQGIDLSEEMDVLLLEKESKTKQLKERYRDWYKWEQGQR